MISAAKIKVIIVRNQISHYFSDFGFVVVQSSIKQSSAISTFPKDWVDRYFAFNFQEIDPVFRIAAETGNHPHCELLTASDMSSPLFEEARMFGADSNIVSISKMGGSTMVLGAVNHDIDKRAVDTIRDDCARTHRQVLLARFRKLTDAQIDLLEAVDLGMPDKEIASDFGISRSAIAQRKQAICHKIGVDRFAAIAGLYSVYKWGGIVPMDVDAISPKQS